jgi:hypothetical protein
MILTFLWLDPFYSLIYIFIAFSVKDETMKEGKEEEIFNYLEVTVCRLQHLPRVYKYYYCHMAAAE